MSFRDKPIQASKYPEDEIELARRLHRLSPGADAGPWVEYNRACAHWRYRVSEWLVIFLASPAEYLRRTRDNRARTRPQINTPAWRRAWEDCYTVARQQVLDLAAEGQRPVSLAWEILERGNRSVLLELVHGGWLPKRPESPSYGGPRRPGPTPEERERQADAAVDAGFGPT